jgi:hypothetical protein
MTGMRHRGRHVAPTPGSWREPRWSLRDTPPPTTVVPWAKPINWATARVGRWLESPLIAPMVDPTKPGPGRKG